MFSCWQLNTILKETLIVAFYTVFYNLPHMIKGACENTLESYNKYILLKQIKLYLCACVCVIESENNVSGVGEFMLIAWSGRKVSLCHFASFWIVLCLLMLQSPSTQYNFNMKSNICFFSYNMPTQCKPSALCGRSWKKDGQWMDSEWFCSHMILLTNLNALNPCKAITSLFSFSESSLFFYCTPFPMPFLPFPALAPLVSLDPHRHGPTTVPTWPWPLRIIHMKKLVQLLSQLVHWSASITPWIIT